MWKPAILRNNIKFPRGNYQPIETGKNTRFPFNQKFRFPGTSIDEWCSSFLYFRKGQLCGVYKHFSDISYREFPFQLTLLLVFPEFSIECFASEFSGTFPRKFPHQRSLFRNFWKFWLNGKCPLSLSSYVINLNQEIISCLNQSAASKIWRLTIMADTSSSANHIAAFAFQERALDMRW